MADPLPRSEGFPCDGDWRAPVLNACLWISALIASVWLALVVVVYPETRTSPELLCVLPGFAAAWFGCVFRRWPEGRRVGLMLFFCLNVAAVGLAMAGARPAVVVMTVLFGLLATLYFGRRGGLAATATVLLTYGLVAIGWVNGILPHTRVFFDPFYLEPRAWVVGTAITLLGTIAVSAVVSFVLAHAVAALRHARESEEKFAMAFRASPDAMIISDFATGEIIDINEGFERLFGRTRAETVGYTSLELAMWADAAERSALLEALQRDGVVRDFRTVGERKGGSKVHLEASAELIVLRGRRCIVGVARDISDRLRHEREREQLAERLRESQKLEALGTLAGGIAHDFNNLLLVMHVNAELAGLEAPNADAVRDHIAQIVAASNRAKDLVGQILAFSRKQPSARKPTELQRVVHEAAKLLRSALPTTIELSVVTDSDCLPVLADESQIHQVIMNLATNAAHAMRERNGKLSIQLWPVQLDQAKARRYNVSPGSYAQLSVADTGHGIAEAIRARIFDPFFTTKAPGEGTGLGLAVVHGIVRSHEGAITVESTEGEGTTFTALLPTLKDRAAVCAASNAAEYGGRGERLLVIDDAPAVVTTVQRTLSGLGYAVESFTSPREGVARFRAAPDAFDLILSDLTMPGLSGIDVLHAVHALRPKIPVLLMTGYLVTWTREKVCEHGARDLLAKPLRRAELGGDSRGARRGRRTSGASNVMEFWPGLIALRFG